MKIPICPQLNVRKEIAFTLVGGCYFFLLLSSPCLSMYDKAVKTTNNRVSTSIVFMGITLLCKTRGHLTIGKSHPYFCSITYLLYQKLNGKTRNKIPCHIPFKCYSSKILISDGFTAIFSPESNSRIARFAPRQLPVFWWQEAGVSLRMWLMKNSVKIVKNSEIIVEF